MLKNRHSHHHPNYQQGFIPNKGSHKMSREISYSDAINEALSQALAQDESVICYGLGADDPKGILEQL